jgi:hypothetical protein
MPVRAVFERRERYTVVQFTPTANNGQGRQREGT